ncbi:MAG: tetratricopeptide repeat protein [Sedimentisphaerales bacterium]|nr:tetratricopeptide repeat protein [Sedimentisphaerales bacterium]
MIQRRFNCKVAVVLVIALLLLVTTAFFFRRWQQIRRARLACAAGIRAYDQRLWHDAARNLGRYLAIDHSNIQIQLKYAEAQMNIRPLKRNNIQQAIAAYRNTLRIDKGNSEAALRLVGLYLKMEMFGEAEVISVRALEANPTPELRRMLAMALASQRKFKEAEKELKNTIKLYPEHVLAYDTLARLIEKRPDDYSESPYFWFNKAVQQNPSAPEAYIIRGAYHLRNEDLEKALADLTRAEKENLSNPATRLSLAEQLINANALDKAEEHLKAVKAADPANQVLWQIWSQLALKSKSQKKMQEVAAIGLEELSSQPWDFLPLAAELFIHAGVYDRAEDCISKLRQADIASQATAYLRGLLSDRMGQGYQAVKYWRRAIQLGANSERTRLALAQTLSRLGDTQSAIKQLRMVVSEQPNLIIARVSLARLLAETGNWPEASEQARTAIQVSPKNVDALLLHAQGLIQLLAENCTDTNSRAWQEIVDNLAALQKTSPDVLQVRILQLQLAIKRSQFNEARQLLNLLENDFSSQPEVAMAEIELLIARNETDAAISKLYDAISDFPQSTRPVRYLVTVLAAQGKRQECESVIKDALSDNKQPAVKSRLALLLSQLYDRWNEQAKRYLILKQLVTEIPDDILLKRELLRCDSTLKQSDRAQRLVDEIKAVEGQKGWQWRYEQARVWFAASSFKNNYPQVVSLLKDNLVVNPQNQGSRILLGAAYERAGELNLATVAYREALNSPSVDLCEISNIVHLLYKAGNYSLADEPDRSLLLCDEIVNRLNDVSAYMLRAKTYAMLGQHTLAKRDFKQAATIEPNNAETWVAISSSIDSMGDTDSAITAIQKAMSIAPDKLSIQKRALSLFLASRKPDLIQKGKCILNNNLLKNSKDMELHIYKAHYLLTDGIAPAMEQATDILKKVTEDEPNFSNAWALLAKIALRQGRSDKAIDVVLQGLSHKPDDKSLLLLKAKLEAAKSPALAVPTLKQLRGLDPMDSRIITLLAETYLAADNCEKAIDLLRKEQLFCNSISDRLRIRAALAVALHKNGEKAEAQEILNSLCQAAPDDRTVLLAQVQVLKNDQLWTSLSQKVVNWHEKYSEDTCTPIAVAEDLITSQNDKAKETAEQILRVIIENHPDSTKAMHILAVLLHVTGHSAESIALYEQILAIEPANVTAMNNLTWILCKEQGQYQQALELAQRGLEIAPSNVDLIDIRGVAYYGLGQYDLAIEDFNLSLKLYADRTPPRVASYLHLGKALAGLEKNEEAIKILRHALELNSDFGNLSHSEITQARDLIKELSQGVSR